MISVFEESERPLLSSSEHQSNGEFSSDPIQAESQTMVASPPGSDGTGKGACD